MLFRSPAIGNGFHLTPPTSADTPFYTAPYHLSGWFFNATAGFSGTVIAPDIVLTADHVADSIPLGTTFTAMGVTRTLIEKIPPTVPADLAFCKMDGVYPDWAYMWNKEPWTRENNWLFMVGAGLGRGDYGTDGDFEWWLWGIESTRARRWGGTRPWTIDVNDTSRIVNNRFRMDNDPGCFGCTQGDSGSGVFIDAGPNKSWVHLGTVTGGTAGSGSERAYWDKPDSFAQGFHAIPSYNHMTQILALGGRVLPSEITITEPVNGFRTKQTLFIKGTTVGNPERINIQLTY